MVFKVAEGKEDIKKMVGKCGGMKYFEFDPHVKVFFKDDVTCICSSDW